MTKAAHYLVQTLGIAAVLVAIVSAFNLIVDPLAWRPNGRFDLYSPNSREIKAHWIGLYRHDGLLIGSSKVNRIDPRSIASPRLFNAAFDGALPEEILAFLTRYAGNERLVLLGLDFYMMKASDGDLNESTFARPDRPPLYGRTPGAWASYLPSLETTGLSAAAVGKFVMGLPGRYSPAGNQIFGPADTAEPRNREAYDGVLKVLAEQHYHMTRYSVRRLAIIRKIKAWAATRGIKLLVFLNPLNADEAALLQSLPAWPLFLRFRRDMHEIFPDLTDFSDAYPAPSAYFPSDPFHYLPRTGTRIIEAVLARRASDGKAPTARRNP